VRRVGTSTRAQKRMARHTSAPKLEHRKARKVWHHKSSSGAPFPLACPRATTVWRRALPTRCRCPDRFGLFWRSGSLCPYRHIWLCWREKKWKKCGIGMRSLFFLDRHEMKKQRYRQKRREAQQQQVGVGVTATARQVPALPPTAKNQHPDRPRTFNRETPTHRVDKRVQE
jgi:hypothetical protein